MHHFPSLQQTYSIAITCIVYANSHAYAIDDTEALDSNYYRTDDLMVTLSNDHMLQIQPCTVQNLIVEPLAPKFKKIGAQI